MNAIVVFETFIAFIIAVSIHEAAHAGAAALLGDGSPAAAGRLSLAPQRQMATIGTIVAVVFSTTAFAGLGWGKPVDVDARRLRVGPDFGLLLVALAAPAVNLLLGLGILFGLQAIPGYADLGNALLPAGTPTSGFTPGCQGALGEALQSCLHQAQSGAVLRVEQFLFVLALTSIVLALVNLIPLHPLDGYRVLYALLPARQAISFRRFEPYMELSLLILFFVLPYLLAIARIDFRPGDLFIVPARSIASSIAANLEAIYAVL